MKIKLLLPLLALLFLSASCAEEEEPLPATEPEPEPTSFCYLLEQTTTAEDSSTSITYTYNEQNQVIRTEHKQADKLVGIRTYEYNTSGRLTRESNLTADSVETDYTVYSYNTQGLLSKYEVMTLLGVGTVHHKGAFRATYNLDGSLRTATSYSYLDNQQRQEENMSFTYRENNPVSVAYTNKLSNQSYTATYTSDQMWAPLSAVPAFHIRNPGMGYPGKRNIVNFTATNSAKEAVKDVSYQAVYEYNQQGYPTSAVYTYGNGKKVTITYSYSCK